MHPTLTIAKHAAEAAGRLQLYHFGKLDRVKIHEKKPHDFVSDVDIRSEEAIIETIRKYHPDHSILAEESGETAGDAEHCWIIDPLDGTNNYLHGIPHFAISIAYAHKGKVQTALVYDPIKQDTFIAARGKGAHLNDTRIRTTSQTSLSKSLIALGRNYPIAKTNLNKGLQQINEALQEKNAITRYFGAASLDLCYVAAGKFDGYFEHSLQKWDLAAGALITQEAGGLVSDFQGGQQFMETGDIVCGSLKVFKPLLKLVNANLNSN
jgi:myo-inositol-1(or 4)-monophosphatase